jgi:hypothetical protein
MSKLKAVTTLFLVINSASPVFGQHDQSGDRGTGGALIGEAMAQTQCTSFSGRCTGTLWWHKKQCVTAPSRMEPDATVMEQCCDGGFQYPWVEVCPGRPGPTVGCGFCVW